eukprot:CAMPEP_0173171474 /NCGR_PEP_ID=MMETSP1141-20130122/1787_1 /TAXON_ID=483371 /ORGANISM="non described non described, Strain CCMP2298" /LENGTH=113 /DNA_ID=CAMNT_0014093431 /DNA_START=126 /DNA_END=467 /DNA_ORIENTATION=+
MSAISSCSRRVNGARIMRYERQPTTHYPPPTAYDEMCLYAYYTIRIMPIMVRGLGAYIDAQTSSGVGQSDHTAQMQMHRGVVECLDDFNLFGETLLRWGVRSAPLAKRLRAGS